MAKRKKQTRRVAKPFNRKVYEKLEDRLLLAQDAILAHRFDEAITYCAMVLDHRGATRTQKIEAYSFIASVHMQTQDFSLAVDALNGAIKLTQNDWMLYFNRSQALLYISQMAQSLKDIERAATLCDEPDWQDKIAERLVFVGGLVAEECAGRGPDFTVDDLLLQQTLFHDGFQALLAKEYAVAETKLKQSIALGDVLPQPWFNLGSVYAQQGDFDSAEKAWRRAVEIDPEYEFAHNNLKHLPDMRAGKELPLHVNSEPYKGKVNNLTMHTIER
jgi:superkiller protein 3